MCVSYQLMVNFMVMRRMSPRVMAVKLMMITTYMVMMVSLVYCTSPGAKAAPKKRQNMVQIMETTGDDLYRPRI